jgi:hypothetical protein
MKKDEEFYKSMRQLKYMRAEAITLNYIEEMRNR